MTRLSEEDLKDIAIELPLDGLEIAVVAAGLASCMLGKEAETARRIVEKLKKLLQEFTETEIEIGTHKLDS